MNVFSSLIPQDNHKSWASWSKGIKSLPANTVTANLDGSICNTSVKNS